MCSWKKEFQCLLDRKMLSHDELAYLFGQVKSIVDRKTEQLQAKLEKVEKENSHLLEKLLAVAFVGNGTQIIGDKRYEELKKAEDKLKALQWKRVGKGLPEKPFKVDVCNTSVGFVGHDTYLVDKKRWESGHEYTHWKPIALPGSEPEEVSDVKKNETDGVI